MRTKFTDYQVCQTLLAKYVERKTMLKHCKNDDQKMIINKIINRIESKKPETSVKDFCNDLIKRRIAQYKYSLIK